MSLVECVPNFSEGRDQSVIDAIRDAIASVEGIVVLDVSSDPSHNRTVVTFVAPVDKAAEAAFRGIKTASELIDLNKHSGEHPRIGATDVCPFIPLEGASMEDCIVLARTLGERVGKELGVPVFLYERAASRPDRVNLADIRRGEFEVAKEEIGKNPNRVPDFGPNKIHPTAPAPRPHRLPGTEPLRRQGEPAGREECGEGCARFERRLEGREGTWDGSRRPGAGVDEPRGPRCHAAASRV